MTRANVHVISIVFFYIFKQKHSHAMFAIHFALPRPLPRFLAGSPVFLLVVAALLVEAVFFFT